VLLRQEDDRVLAIGQPSHSWLSGQLARAWGNERFGAVEPLEDVCLAAEQHDIGMGAWDAEPELNPDTGLPYSFTEIPVTRHVEQWTDGPRRLCIQSRYAGLLTSLHGARLQRRRDLDRLEPAEAAAVRAYLDEQGRLQDRLKSSLGADPALLERNHQLLWIWDFLSLALCLDWAPTTAHDVPTAGDRVGLELRPRGQRAVALSPWPFRGDGLVVYCEGRSLDGRYENDEGLRAALAQAPWERPAFELTPE